MITKKINNIFYKFSKIRGLVQKHDAKKKIYSAQKEAQTFCREFDLSKLPKEVDEFASCHAKRTKQ